ncbi:MAG TPA: hypothetical protein VF763_05985 [Candidatus Limnocylindrales bacterium]
MPFNLFRRKDEAGSAASGQGAASGAHGPGGPAGHGVAFDGLTEEWRLLGEMHIDGRLSDALNRREAIPISAVSWAPADGSSPLEPVPGLRSIDPYDLIVVLAGEGSQPPLSEAERAAHRVHKVGYDVALDAAPYTVYGTVYLHPGSEPERLLDRATDLFVAVTDAEAYLGEQRVGDPDVDTVLVNRSYLRGVKQIDRRTRQPHRPLPGQPLGGVSWTDRSR